MTGEEQKDGTLMSRAKLGALIESPQQVADHATQLVTQGIRFGGKQVQVETLCLHGDNYHAPENAKVLRQKLKENGIDILPL